MRYGLLLMALAAWVRVEPGRFRMGESGAVPDSMLEPLTYPTRAELRQRFPGVANFRIPFEARRYGDFDEHPVHWVRISRAFEIGAAEVTNAQYAEFDPSRARRDQEPAVFVSWHDAKRYCEWLSRKEGVPYRLPTEAEWEYAARSNLLGAGKVEQWIEDWYGPYQAGEQTDPAGPADGDFKVTRRGGEGYYGRPANRSGALPDTRSELIGFRVARAGPLGRHFRAAAGLPSGVPGSAPRHDPRRPYFRGPRRFVRIPPDSHGPLYSHHNHDTAIAECPNGDLLAIWYTCEQERGRELAIASGRLRRGADQWDPSQPFWDAPDRNDHCPALWFDGKQTLYHFNGLAMGNRWEPLAIILRTSTDSGRTWSKARFIAPEFGFRNMVGQPVFRTRDGAIVFGADAGGGSTIWVSRDEGATWADPGGTIRGIHAGIVQLLDGRLLAFGRGQEIGGWMPQSISADMGRTWTSRASGFPPIGGGQRLVLMRLREGPLFFAGFAGDIQRFAPLQEVASHRGAMSLFAALSYDEGRTWPVRRIITDGLPEHPAETIDGGRIRMSPATSEPQGYLAATQARDGIIHLISSVNHYAFNQAWLEQPQPPASRAPAFQPDPRVAFHIDVEASGDGEVELWDPSGALVTNHYRFAVGAGRGSIAVREDTAAQVNGQSAVAPEIIIDWRLPARGRHLEFRGGVTRASIRGARPRT
ncbi:MAG: SUMF1/EgtB/PvdO family nonheme iron enzyme [Bryobacteraceae bacterium]